MTAPSSPHPTQPLLARLVRQHARTAQLWGADSVPVYRMEASAVETPTPDAPIAHVPIEAAAPPASARTQPALLASPPTSGGASSPHVPAQQATKPTMPTSTTPPKGGVRTPGALAEFAFTPPTRHAAEDERAFRTRALEALRARYEADAPHNQFVTAFTNIVFGDGDPCAELCFVGEAPGAEEDAQGKPFVGRSGELLNKMIVAMGLSRERVYICNVLKTRPPDNATPTTREIDICRPYLLAQLSIVRPKAIVTLGLPAVRALLRSDETMARLRGVWASITLQSASDAPLVVPVMPTYHPAYLLRSYSPENRAKVWSDLLLVLKQLGMPLPTKGSAGANP